jgi:hypothetical protein
MMARNKTLLAIAALALIAGGYLLFSRYLAGRLDGAGGVSAPQEHMLQYSSEEGYSLAYPDTYELSSRTETGGGQVWDVLTLVPKGYVPPQDGEGPPAITVSSFSDAEGLPLEQFLQSEPKTNYGLSDQVLAPVAVGGKPALAYTYGGLYENDAIAAAANGRVYVFAAGWMQAGDRIRGDFRNVIKSVQFRDAN